MQALAAVLDSFVFDAPAPWLSPQALAEAVESARPAGGTRFRPPRPDDRQDLAEKDLMPVDDTAELRAAAERLLGDRGSVSVAELLDEAGDWPTGRRLVGRDDRHSPSPRPGVRAALGGRSAHRSGSVPLVGLRRMVRAARRGVSVNQTETALWWARARAAGPQRILPGGPAPAGMLRLPEPDGSGAWLLPVLPDNASAAVLDELGLPGHVLEHPNDTARVLAACVRCCWADPAGPLWPGVGRAMGAGGRGVRGYRQPGRGGVSPRAARGSAAAGQVQMAAMGRRSTDDPARAAGGGVERGAAEHVAGDVPVDAVRRGDGIDASRSPA